MRLFIGLPLDIKTKNKLSVIQYELKRNGVIGNFTLKNNLHLTLAFLGEVDSNRLDELITLVNDIKYKVSLELDSISMLKNIIVYNVIKSKELIDLYHKLIDELKKHNFDINDDFKPHITLVREAKNTGIINKLNYVKIVSLDNDPVLFESVRVNGELRYIIKS